MDIVVCPPVRPGMVGSCAERCSGDDECDDGEKCCSNGCGHECTTTVKLNCAVSS